MNFLKVSIIIPAYNEEKSIHETIKALKTVMKKTKYSYEIIVVNDGSSDGTAAVLSRETGVITLAHDRNIGYGAALKTGIKHSKGDIIAITDADGSYPVDRIPNLLTHMSKYDMVVGARKLGSKGIPFFRKPAKVMLSIMSKYITETKIPDLNSGLRCFKRELAEKYFHLFPNGFSFTTTITVASLIDGYNVKYIPITYARRIGTSKMKPREFINFVTLLTRMAVYFKPFKFFLPIGFLLIVASFAVFFYTLMYLNQIAEITVALLFLTGLQFLALGLVADLIIKRSK